MNNFFRIHLKQAALISLLLITPAVWAANDSDNAGALTTESTSTTAAAPVSVAPTVVANPDASAPAAAATTTTAAPAVAIKPDTSAPAIPAPVSMKDNMAIAGVTYELTGQKLNVLIDQDKVISVSPALAKQEIIAKVTDDDLKKTPVAISVYAVGLPFSIIMLPELYKQNPSLDKLHVDAYVLPSGSTKKELCYSFDYDRASSEKLDMNKMTAKDFITSTPGFVFADWCKDVLNKEEAASK